MSRKMSIRIGIFLLVIAACFVGYAMSHPEAGFPWSNRITFMLYGMYGWLLFRFLVDIPVLRRIRQSSDGTLLRGLMFFFLSAVFLIMEFSGETVGIHTVIRGFIVVGGIDVGMESLYCAGKQKKK